MVHVVLVSRRVAGEPRRIDRPPRLGKRKIRLAPRPPLGGGNDVVHAPGRPVADRHARLGGGLRTQRNRGLPAAEIATGLGNDVHRPIKRVASIDRGTRPRDDLDPVNQIHIENEIRADVSGLIDRIVQTMPVDQDKRAGVVVVRPGKTTRAHILVKTVAAHMQARSGPQGVGKRGPAVVLDVRRREHGHRGGGAPYKLLVFGNPGHGLDRYLHQLLQGHLLKRSLFLLVRRPKRGDQQGTD